MVVRLLRGVFDLHVLDRVILQTAEMETAKEHVDRKIAPIRLWIALIAECTENLGKILRRYLDSDPRQKSNASAVQASSKTLERLRD